MCVGDSSFFQTPLGAAAIQVIKIKNKWGKYHFAHISNQVYIWFFVFVFVFSWLLFQRVIIFIIF